MNTNKYNYIKQIPGLSATEAGVIASFDYYKKGVISNKDFDEFLPLGFKYKNMFISRLIKKRVLQPIKRGFYKYVPLIYTSSGLGVNNFIVPGLFFPKKNYYIGYSSLYNTYGFSEQIFQNTYVLNTSFSATKEIDGSTYEFIKVSDKYLYGTEERDVADGKTIWSDKERTLIDLIYFPEPVGGLKQALKILERVIENKECEIKKFIEYVVRFPNIKTRKRIGWTLEKIGINTNELELLANSIKNTALTPFYGVKDRTGKIDKKWRAILNDIAT
jgi:predicted transcriptional regulator of viral defense system